MAAIHVTGGLVASILGLTMSDAALGDAYRIPYHGAAAAGQAEAFSAQADDPSALYYNPAGLAQLRGVQSSLGVNLVGGYTSFTSPTGFRSRGDVGETLAFPPPSNFYLTANLEDLGFEALGPLTVGLGMTSSYGLASRCPDPTPFEEKVTRAKLPMLDIKPTIAYRVTDMLSLGLGADIYTFASFIGSGGYEVQATSPVLGRTELSMNGTTAGINGSLLLTPWRSGDGKPQLNLALVYRGGAKLPLHGSYTSALGTLGANSALELPRVITPAVAVWPIRDAAHEWKLEYDMDFVGWDTFRSFGVQLSNGMSQNSATRWRSTYSLSAGTEFKWLSPDWLPALDVALRGGYGRSATPIPSATYTPVISDANWNTLALGLGATCQPGGRFLGIIRCGGEGSFTPKTLGVDLAFQTNWFEPRTIGDSIDLCMNGTQCINGTYKTMIYVGSISFRMSY